MIVSNSVWSLRVRPARGRRSFRQSLQTRAQVAFFHPGLEDQTREFGAQVFAFGQSQADLLRSEPDNPSLDPANLDGFHLDPARFGLELNHPPGGLIYLGRERFQKEIIGRKAGGFFGAAASHVGDVSANRGQARRG
jgi:hypothetical protein